MNPMLRNHKGFTLMETLLVTVIFSITLIAILGIFQTGMHIWKRTQGSGSVQRKAVLTLEKMGKDLRSQIRTESKDLKPSGSSQTLAFPALTTVRSGETLQQQYGMIRYQWNSSRNEICRQEISATALYTSKEEPCRVVASGVTKLRFQYYLYDGIGSKYSWYDEFDERDEPPLAVRVAISLKGPEKGARERTVTKTVLIKTGGHREVEKDETETATAAVTATV